MARSRFCFDAWVLLVRATHEEAVAHLSAARVDGSVGPTAPSGWTCIWLHEDDVESATSLRFATHVWADESQGRVVLEVQRPGAATTRVVWPGSQDDAVTSSVAGALVELFGPGWSLALVRGLLAPTYLDLEQLRNGLQTLLNVPETAGPDPERSVVASRGEPSMIRVAAAIVGPTWLVAAPPDWTVTVPVRREPSLPEELACAVSGATQRKDRAVLLWTHGVTFGLQVWRGGSLDASWTWGSGWETVVADWLEVETAVCTGIAPVNPDLHLPTLRALMRREDLDPAGIVSLVELLDLPPMVMYPLGSSPDLEGLPGAELIERATATRAALSVLRSAQAESDPVQHRRVYLAYAVGTALAALVCLAMTALTIAVAASNGTVVDQSGVTAEDRVLVGVFAVLTLILTPTAVYRFRRLRRISDEAPRAGTANNTVDT